ncbi:sterol desaturase family protein [Pseudoalteromonas denitrificans]|uniref:Sterol desaturase/sphingolipid hydroxylase, fatty acid hydroxylase superfamily n=1 Tax=Pseudoalteromonas denitrificans DSM 6059 TaxID=1123010 RepID=A0A1I1GUV6_9GAMM|nr:sterol desaturase family protein [Pseudoalteromonas denitrificans]SFC12800.1 Sterol desaturase/sphingolipid hydroxylase, fatty acid hydroxylase superfamily [Pseudoalteromonas denitrificans DSM 6059]
MDYLLMVFSEDEVYWLEKFVDDWFFVLAIAVFIIELIRYAIKSKITWNFISDSITNFVTLFATTSINALFAVLFYVTLFYFVYEHYSITHLPMTGWTIAGCIILADLAYYWEHRFLHSNGFAWATHNVHHSSPHFNISVAYRHGPLDGLFPLFFHLPLAFLGFNPLIIFFSEVFVQVFQTLLHTEAVKKFPTMIEGVFNTPSHHRVHHATNKKYLDKNYAGIFIIWDRMFGTFAKEDEKVNYGVFPRVNSVNPLKVYFYGYYKLGKQLIKANSWHTRLRLFYKTPIWGWKQENK